MQLVDIPSDKTRARKAPSVFVCPRNKLPSDDMCLVKLLLKAWLPLNVLN